MPEPDHNLTEVERTEKFSSVLAGLLEYKGYFTDDKKNKQLIRWVSEEFNVSNATANLTVKYIAPFVLGKLLAAGEVIGKSWLRKLNDNLSEHNWYLSFTLKLLNLLKNRTDDSLEKATKTPSNYNLKILIENEARWENLKPEQQAVVRLLLGQNQLLEAQEILRKQIDNLIVSFEFDLDLNSPIHIEEMQKETTPGSAMWLAYYRRNSEFIGRVTDLKNLREFIDQDADFSWWSLTGVGGVGKSRLVLEFMIEQQTLWQVGLLPEIKLNRPDPFANWMPRSPTLIVIDRAADKADIIANWLEYLTKHKSEYFFPVRLLLLERKYQKEVWWDEVLAPKLQDNNYRQNTLYRSQPHELKALTFIEQQTILLSFLGALGCNIQLPENGDYFWVTVDHLSDGGRPLFIGMIAIAVANGGLHQIRSWEQNELLNDIYVRERSVWLSQIASEGLSNSQDAVLTLLTLSTVTMGFSGNRSADEVYEASEALKLFTNELQLEKALKVLPILTGNKGGYLQPDIFAEYVVLQHWQNEDEILPRSVQKQLSSAYAISEQETLSFIRRAVTDFPDNPTSQKIWRFLLAEVDSSESLQELGLTALKGYVSLALKGEHDNATKLWLLPSIESKDAEIREYAIFTLAMNESIIRMISGLNCYLQDLKQDLDISMMNEKHILQYTYVFSVAKLLGNTRLLDEFDKLAKNFGLDEGWGSIVLDTKNQSLGDIQNEQGGVKVLPNEAFTDKDRELFSMLAQLSYLSESDDSM